MLEQGYIQVYTGNGKGKTTAALGLALRAAGRNKKTYIAQFMKKSTYGELLALEKFLKEYVTIEQFGLPEFHYSGRGVTDQERNAAQAGLEAVKNAVASNLYDIIIMDEINMVVYFKVLEQEPVLEILDHKPIGLELVLTGRGASPEILQRAHLITEMVEIKHYYAQKVQAREGIEM